MYPNDGLWSIKRLGKTRAYANFQTKPRAVLYASMTKKADRVTIFNNLGRIEDIIVINIIDLGRVKR